MELKRLTMDIWFGFKKNKTPNAKIKDVIMDLFLDLKNSELNEIILDTDHSIRFHNDPKKASNLLSFVSDTGTIRLNKDNITINLNLSRIDHTNIEFLNQELIKKYSIASHLFNLIVSRSTNTKHILSNEAHIHMRPTYNVHILPEILYKNTGFDTSTFENKNSPFMEFVHGAVRIEYQETSGILSWGYDKNNDGENHIHVRLTLHLIEDVEILDNLPIQDILITLDQYANDFEEEYLVVR